MISTKKVRMLFCLQFLIALFLLFQQSISVTMSAKTNPMQNETTITLKAQRISPWAKEMFVLTNETGEHSKVSVYSALVQYVPNVEGNVPAMSFPIFPKARLLFFHGEKKCAWVGIDTPNVRFFQTKGKILGIQTYGTSLHITPSLDECLLGAENLNELRIMDPSKLDRILLPIATEEGRIGYDELALTAGVTIPLLQIKKTQQFSMNAFLNSDFFLRHEAQVHAGLAKMAVSKIMQEKDFLYIDIENLDYPQAANVCVNIKENKLVGVTETKFPDWKWLNPHRSDKEDLRLIDEEMKKRGRIGSLDWKKAKITIQDESGKISNAFLYSGMLRPYISPTEKIGWKVGLESREKRIGIVCNEMHEVIWQGIIGEYPLAVFTTKDSTSLLEIINRVQFIAGGFSEPVFEVALSPSFPIKTTEKIVPSDAKLTLLALQYIAPFKDKQKKLLLLNKKECTQTFQSFVRLINFHDVLSVEITHMKDEIYKVNLEIKSKNHSTTLVLLIDMNKKEVIK